MASLAELLDYDQRKKQMLDALQTGFNKGYSVADAFTHGLADQVGGVVGLMTTDPRETISNLYQAGKSVVQNPRGALQAAKEGLTEAVSSPENIARFAGQNFSPADIANALNKVGTMRELTVYHGTPHKFEPTPDNPLGEFTASKIGTGEGAAAYGHGIYTAQNPKIALSYKRNLSSKDEVPNVNYKGQHYLNKIPELVGAKGEAVRNIAEVLREDLPFNEAKVRAKAMAQYKYDNDLKSVRAAGLSDEDALYTPEEHKNILNEIDNLDSSIVQRVGEPKDAGYLYTAHLPDEKIDQMLDWDKPLSEQSAHVQNAILGDINTAIEQTKARMSGASERKAFATKIELEKLEKEKNRMLNLFGEDLYKQMSLGEGKFAPDASSQLRQLGIPGIKYLDEQSRAKGTGTRNFVVFPGEEKNLKILSRE